jgi:uncharacterized Tic20 family protein
MSEDVAMAEDELGGQPSQEPDLYAVRQLSSDEKNWAMFCHLSTFVGAIVPFGNIIAPLVIWLLKKEESEFVDYHGREAVNFQITISIAYVVAFVLIFVLIGFLLLPALMIFDLVVTIIAAVKASNGEYYRYPLSIRLIN